MQLSGRVDARNKPFADPSRWKGMYVCLRKEGKNYLPFDIHAITRSLFFVCFLLKLHCPAFPEGAALHPG